jgi:hypothetical protein
VVRLVVAVRAAGVTEAGGATLAVAVWVELEVKVASGVTPARAVCGRFGAGWSQLAPARRRRTLGLSGRRGARRGLWTVEREVIAARRVEVHADGVHTPHPSPG